MRLKQRIRKTFLYTVVVIIAFMILGMYPHTANAADTVANGSCGTSVTWTLDSEGTLTISGTGEMTDYSSGSSVPWYNTYVKDYQNSEDGVIKRAVIEDGVTSIGNYAFFQCQHVIEVSIPESVIRIGSYSFSNCKSLREITIPSKAKEIRNQAFQGCTSLQSISVMAASIGGAAFSGCTGLETISFGDGVNSIEPSAFNGCSALQGVTVADSNLTFFASEGILFNKDKTELIRCPAGRNISDYSVPNTVEKIGSYAFTNCDTLESINMSDSVTAIGEKEVVNTFGEDYGAFQGCDYLESVTFSKRMTVIGAHSFMDCPKLKTVTIPGCISYIGDSAFGRNSGLANVYFRGNKPYMKNSFWNSNNVFCYYPESDTSWASVESDQVFAYCRKYTPDLTSVAAWNIKVEESSFTYDGTEKKPAVTVNTGDENGAISLTEGTEYDLYYEDNIMPGTASVIVTGKGEYTGEIKTNFRIAGASMRVQATTQETTYYNGEEHRPEVNVYGPEEYEIYYSTTGELNADNYQTAGSKEVPSRTMSGKLDVWYYVIDLLGGYEPWAGMGTILIRPAVTAKNYSGTYDRTNHKPEIGAEGGATLYYSTSTVLDFNNFETSGSRTLPGRTAVGTTTIYYIAVPDDNPSDALSVSGSVAVTISKAIQEISAHLSADNIGVGQTTTIVASASEGTLSYVSLDESIATVDDSGQVRGVGEGTTVIVVTAAETTNYKAAKAEVEVTVGPLGEKWIANCDIILTHDALTYQGKAVVPNVTVRDADVVLVENRDYTITCPTAENVGNYTLRVDGIGAYQGSKEVGFTIIQAAAKLAFEAGQMEKVLGEDAFVNPLQAVTDGTVSFTSDNPSVAEVDTLTGQVTLRGAGTTTITATASAGTNYLAGQASYVLDVVEADVEKRLNVENLSYSFDNSKNSFGYPDHYIIPLNSYQMIFGNTTKANYYFSLFADISWGGSCAGFSGTSALLFDEDSGISVKDFKESAESIRELSPQHFSTKLGMRVTDFMEAMQISQQTQLFTRERERHRVYTKKHLLSGTGNLNGIYRGVLSETAAGKPVLLALYQGNGQGHAVLAYDVKNVSEDEAQILLYDNNYPMQERALTLKKDSTGNYMEWSYPIADQVIWGTDSSKSSISYISYATIKEIWTTRGHLQENENVVAINSKSIAIRDSNDNVVATVTQGDLYSVADDIYMLDDLSRRETAGENILLSMPVDVYTFVNLDKSVDEFSVSVTDTNLGATVSTSANELTVAVDDSCNMNAVYINAGEEDIYSVTLNSSFSNDDDNVVVTGKGQGERLEISQIKGSIKISNCNIVSVSANGQDLGPYRITTVAGIGGTILPEGGLVLTKGEDAEVQINADTDYEISDVLVDGRSVGAVATYTFSAITEDHKIEAVFRRRADGAGTGDSGSTPAYHGAGSQAVRRDNTITAEDIILTSSGKVRTISLGAKALENAPLSYVSDNSSVKVSAMGMVTIPKNYIGGAAITVTSGETASYGQTRRVVHVTVNPTGTKLSKLKSGGGKKLTVTWKKNSKVTGYEISYSTSSKFKTEKIAVIKKKKTVKTVLKKLKKKKYYVRIRTYKTVAGVKYYSAWSKKKSVKVR